MDDQTVTGLPASMEMAWGVRERPHKGPKRGLSLDRIVEAGVKVASTEGIAAVSMGRVAAELGASTMALYRYVRAKEELLELMVDAALGPAPTERDPDEGWRAGLSRWARTYFSILGRHPWIVRIPISGPPVAPNSTAWLEDALHSLRATGLTGHEKMSVILLLSGFVRNTATLGADLQDAYRATGSTEQAVLSAYGRFLARLADAARFPELRKVIDAGVFDEPDEPDTEFVFGLERVLDGVEALVRARG